MAKRSIQSKYLALVLYPDEDRRHKLVFDYILTNKVLYPEVLYIKHDRDYQFDESFPDVYGDEANAKLLPRHQKKSHFHVFIELHMPSTAKGFLNRFRFNGVPMLEYVQLLNDPIAYIQYMLHIDFASMCDNNKVQYEQCELIGSEKWRSRAFEINSVESNFEGLEYLYRYVKENGLEAFFKSAQNLPPKQMQHLYELYRANQGIVMRADTHFMYVNKIV